MGRNGCFCFARSCNSCPGACGQNIGATNALLTLLLRLPQHLQGPYQTKVLLNSDTNCQVYFKPKWLFPDWRPEYVRVRCCAPGAPLLVGGLCGHAAMQEASFGSMAHWPCRCRMDNPPPFFNSLAGAARTDRSPHRQRGDQECQVLQRRLAQGGGLVHLLSLQLSAAPIAVLCCFIQARSADKALLQARHTAVTFQMPLKLCHFGPCANAPLFT